MNQFYKNLALWLVISLMMILLFNLFNKPIWGDPTMAMSSPLYGQINTTRSPMRELQIGVKFAF